MQYVELLHLKQDVTSLGNALVLADDLNFINSAEDRGNFRTFWGLATITQA